jgi:hypothetical protein
MSLDVQILYGTVVYLDLNIVRDQFETTSSDGTFAKRGKCVCTLFFSYLASHLNLKLLVTQLINFLTVTFVAKREVLPIFVQHLSYSFFHEQETLI